MMFDPPQAPRLTGTEPFEGVEAAVIDFWRFAMTDLRTNNVRGYLAEFLVARAVGSTAARVEWAPWDVTSPNGARIEVKSSGYLQAWGQSKLSVPRFQVGAAYGWDEATGAWSTTQLFHADAYVFGLHTAVTHDEYDPLAVSQWQFYVTGREAIATQAGASMSLTTLSSTAGRPHPFSELDEAIASAAEPSRVRRSN
ncbi:hypothetical protein EUA06_05910 [Nocardioides glacieisoli]|uniref:Uncharacterized protein n=1 Tax=Nocardioides glacieisoli TaxID=1168730 RepID=A0A4Q2RXY9_9ACTN|nr:hypothetical protein [Nocardioides glacieisoli]RYB92483.1 hypothetical protein EUA06_05910 [Nocardioides glacieisoli]